MHTNPLEYNRPDLPLTHTEEVRSSAPLNDMPSDKLGPLIKQSIEDIDARGRVYTNG